MARVLPQLTEAQLDALPSRAEARFYRACRDRLDEHLLVLYSVLTIRPSIQNSPDDREVDFVIFDPQGGFLVVEIKGGRIFRADRKWSSVNGRAGKIVRVP